MRKAETYVEETIMAGEVWQNPGFPPEITSIYGTENDIANKLLD